MVKEGKLPFVFKKRPTRIGVLPRYAESGAEVRWFDTGACPVGWLGDCVVSCLACHSARPIVYRELPS